MPGALPGGHAGVSQMTPAMRSKFLKRQSLSRRRHKAAAGYRRHRRAVRKKFGRSRTHKSSNKIKFGSPAWQKKYKTGKYARRKK